MPTEWEEGAAIAKVTDIEFMDAVAIQERFSDEFYIHEGGMQIQEESAGNTSKEKDELLLEPKGMQDKAIEELKSTIRLREQNPEAHNNLGIAYRKKGMYQEAYNEYQKALQFNPGYSDAHNNLGVLYTKINKIDLAIEEFKLAIANKQIYPDAHNNLGLLYANLGKLDPAIEEFKNAIYNKPDYPEAYNNLGTAYLKKDMYDEAIHEFLNAISYDKHYIKAYYNLSTAYYNKGYYDKATDGCRTILSLDPNHQDAITLLNAINQKLGSDPVLFEDTLSNEEIPGAPSFNVKQHKYASYFNHIRQRISLYWFLAYGTRAEIKLETQQDKPIIIEFKVLPNGTIEKVNIVEDAGNYELASRIVSSIKTASPLDPFPSNMKEPLIDVRFNFFFY